MSNILQFKPKQERKKTIGISYIYNNTHKLIKIDADSLADLQEELGAIILTGIALYDNA